MKKKITTVLIMIVLAVGLHMGLFTEKADAFGCFGLIGIAYCVGYAQEMYELTMGLPANLGGGSTASYFAECMSM